MSLARALTKLPRDTGTEQVLRDTLSVFRRHPSEWLSVRDIQSKTGHPDSDVRAILPVLSDAFVLVLDSESGRYRYDEDIALAIEIDMFMRRVSARQSDVHDNIARFRSRYGS